MKGITANWDSIELICKRRISINVFKILITTLHLQGSKLSIAIFSTIETIDS